MNKLYIDFKTAYDSVRMEVFYNILIEFGIPVKLVRLIIIGLNEMYNRARVGKDLSDMFPIRNGLKQGDALSPLLFNFALEECFSTFVRPRPGKFFFCKMRAWSQQIYS